MRVLLSPVFREERLCYSAYRYAVLADSARQYSGEAPDALLSERADSLRDTALVSYSGFEEQEK